MKQENAVKYYGLSAELIWLCHDISGYVAGKASKNSKKPVYESRPRTAYGNIEAHCKMGYPGMSVELLVNNEKVFEAGKFVGSGTIVYSKFKVEAITLELLDRLYRIRGLVETEGDEGVTASIRADAGRRLGRLTKR